MFLPFPKVTDKGFVVFGCEDGCGGLVDGVEGLFVRRTMCFAPA
jgi:hypothetical protein